jgi:hypothetical protein
VRRDIDALADEAHAFHFEPRELFEAGLELQLDLAARADHSLPGQVAMPAAQQRGHVPVIERIAGGGRDLAVGRHLALRNLADRLAEGRVALLAFGRAHQLSDGLLARQTLHASSRCRKQPVRWSLTMPVACMNA